MFAVPRFHLLKGTDEQYNTMQGCAKQDDKIEPEGRCRTDIEMNDVGKEIGSVGEEQQPEARASPCKYGPADVMDTMRAHSGKPCQEEVPEQEAEVDIAMPDHTDDNEGHQDEEADDEAEIVAEEGAEHVG